MSNDFGEVPTFQIESTYIQRPFRNPAVRSFFSDWCKINDSIEPLVVDRKTWKQRGAKGILEKRPDGKQALYIPEDLQLWEMIGVTEVVDNDTFAGKPERQDEAVIKIQKLGRTFKNAGTYIAQRLNSIPQGREIAQALAEEFYEYGQSLINRKKPRELGSIDDIASQTLTEQEIEEVDRFLAGDSLYETRRARAENVFQQSTKNKIFVDPKIKSEIYEAERKKSLAQFFRVSEKAFELERKTRDGELTENNIYLEPWQNNTPIHQAFIYKIEDKIDEKIETPKRELEDAIFRRGLEGLVSKMKGRGWEHGVNVFFEKVGINLQVEQSKIIDELRIYRLKAELEFLRQSADTVKISNKEREIADKIQKVVSRLPRMIEGHYPSRILFSQSLNCVGASVLGGALMQEVGLNYLVGLVPEHSILFLVTSDGQVEWRDMLNPLSNGNLTDEMISGKKKNGSPLTIADIVAFSWNPKPEGLLFDINSKKYREKTHRVKNEQRQYVVIFGPEHGQKIQILNNFGNTLHSLGYDEEAVEAYRQAIMVDSKFSYPYLGLGNAYHSLGRKWEAMEAYRKAISIDPEYSPAYYGLGEVLYRINHNEEAVEAFSKAIAINPFYSYSYYEIAGPLLKLNRNEEAINYLQEFVDLADKNKDDQLIKQAQTRIDLLKK